MKKIYFLLLTLVMFQLNCFAAGYYVNGTADRAYNQKLDLKNAVIALNQAIKLDYGLNKRQITNTADFKPMFQKTLMVIPEKTTNDSFTTRSGNTYKIVPLRSTCYPATDLPKMDVTNACAKVIITPKNVNNSFEVLLYSDAVYPPSNSELYTLLYSN